jgi:hypothetical protein
MSKSRLPLAVFLMFFLARRNSSSLAVQAPIFVLFVTLLVGVDYLMDYAGIIRFAAWSVWGSFAEWIFIKNADEWFILITSLINSDA